MTLALAALKQRLGAPHRRQRPTAPQRILIAHHLLLGDTLMLTPLLARLRARHPQAEIALTISPRLAALYRTAPYGVRAIAYSPDDKPALQKLLRAERGFDLALIPGDNRHALFALAAGARWIVAFAQDRPAWKNWICDELIPFPRETTAVGDLFAGLAGEPSPEERFDPRDWPPPVARDAPVVPGLRTPYAVLHVGAGNPLRLWSPNNWRALAERLAAAGITPLFCCGPKEAPLIRAIDSAGKFLALNGPPLDEIWPVLAGSALLVCLDSGISHLAKIIGTPTVVLYGPGSPELFGPGEFWRANRFRALWISDMPCRDQAELFKRSRPWIRRCGRKPSECKNENACMARIDAESVAGAALSLLKQTR